MNEWVFLLLKKNSQSDLGNFHTHYILFLEIPKKKNSQRELIFSEGN
jgi:hypothetical protein